MACEILVPGRGTELTSSEGKLGALTIGQLGNSSYFVKIHPATLCLLIREFNSFTLIVSKDLIFLFDCFLLVLY